MIQSCTANRNQLIHGSFVMQLSWHILERADVLCLSGYLLPCHLKPSVSNVNTLSQKSVGLRGEAKIVLTSYYLTMHRRGSFLHEQTEIKSCGCRMHLCVCLVWYSPLASSAPLSKVPSYISSPTCSCTTCRKKNPY